MSTMLLVSLVGIAALDSLNPTGITLQIYLLSTPKPIARSIAFILGVFLTYWAAGLLAVLGLRSWLLSVMSSANVSFSEHYFYALQLLIGLALLIGGVRLDTSPQTPQGKRPKRLTLGRTFLLGMGVTIFDLPTALPYLAAIEQIARAKLDVFSIMGVLGLYNLVFVSPQIMLFGIYLLFHQQSRVLLRRINRSIAIWSPKILRGLLLGLGVLLILDSIGYSLGRSFIKL